MVQIATEVLVRSLAQELHAASWPKEKRQWLILTIIKQQSNQKLFNSSSENFKKKIYILHIYEYIQIYMYEYICKYMYDYICKYIFFLKKYIYIFTYQGGSSISFVQLPFCLSTNGSASGLWEHSLDVENINKNTCFRGTFSKVFTVLP